MLVKVETYYDGEFWCARGIGEDIFTLGENLDQLMGNIKAKRRWRYTVTSAYSGERICTSSSSLR